MPDPHFSNTPAYFKEIASGDTPSSGQVALYAKSDGKMYYKDDAGVETEVGGGGLVNITETLHTASPNNTVNAEQLEVTGGTTNVDLVLTPKGTGAFIVGNEPDSGTTGGNKPGTGAISMVVNRSAANQAATGVNSVAIGFRSVASGDRAIAIGPATASGVNSLAMAGDFGSHGGNASGTNSIAILGAAANDDAVSIGRASTSSGARSFSFGNASTASGSDSYVIGRFCVANSANGFAHGISSLANRQMLSYANGGFAASGDAQKVLFVCRNKTTTNSAVTLFLDGSSTRLTIPSGKIFSGTVNIVGTKSDGTAVARYLRQVSIKNVGGTTSLVGSVITLGTDEPSGTSISITADDTNDALSIQVTGIASETWRWVATIEGAEVAYGT